MQIVVGLAIGVAGGAIFALAQLPAPWLAGSMIACVVAVYSGIRFYIPNWLRTLAFILLGLQTGASVTWDTLERASQWPLSLVALAMTVAFVTWGGYAFYRSARHWDAPTAFFASLPGALSLVLALADEARADMRRVTISQSIRLFFLVAALPAIIALLSPEHAVIVQSEQGDLVGSMLMLAAAALGGLGFERLRIPAGLILGSALASAAIALAGITHGATPSAVLIPANVILGVMIASRFHNFSLSALKTSFGEGFAGFVIALAISVIGALGASWVADLPFALTLLAFSPGGLDAMTIMAFALGLDPAYVAAHQVARYIGLCLLLPPITAWLLRPRAAIEPKANTVGADED